ncbi:MerR family transcriptional regulator [Rubrobacter calidifluminis]|uniref:MerR family transcriptional regulator n=1 Tax=Rubrobacter calidifluminis TaxID=1392640 RepID=UPI0023620631|nr:MerR family transcriptional regulator [Rubrobacter calidifluminis]
MRSFTGSLDENQNEAVFKIGEAARAVGVSAQTLRLWERERLIQPRRTERGYRLYTNRDIERLRQIKYLRSAEGLNFAAIRKQLGRAGGRDAGGEKGNFPGERLRRLRLKRRKTLREISEVTGLSVSFISALERGGSGASVASLKRLADAYGVNMRELFGVDVEQDSPLVRARERPVMQWENGVRFEEMAPGGRAMDPSYVYVPAGAGSEGFYSHTGEEFIHLLSGKLTVELKDNGRYHLEPGDTLYFPSTVPHRWWAPETHAEMIYVNNPPTF